MRLKCLLDICPQTGQAVDMRICCDGTRRYLGGLPHMCQFYSAKRWSETGSVTCNHPQAVQSTKTDQEERASAFRATAGVQHVL